MNIPQEAIVLGTELAGIVGRMSAETIFDRIKVARKNKNKDEVINSLEEIINDLISDKNALIQIAHAYEEQIITQKITDSEIEYITESIIPLIESFISESDDINADKIQGGIDIIKSVLSKETFTILQIVGFNFKKAIGEPLTELMAALINAKAMQFSDKKLEVQLLAEQREIEYIKLCQNEDAYNRLMSIFNK